MRSLRPMPRRALPDSARVLLAGGDVRVLRHVRFDVSSALDEDDYGARRACSGCVYVDAVMTDGAFEVPVGSVLESEGRRFKVTGCRLVRGNGGRVHHWKLTVVGIG